MGEEIRFVLVQFSAFAAGLSCGVALASIVLFVLSIKNYQEIKAISSEYRRRP